MDDVRVHPRALGAASFYWGKFLLTRRVGAGIISFFFRDRNPILIGRPGTEIALLTPFRAEWPEGRLRAPFDGLCAGWAIDGTNDHAKNLVLIRGARTGRLSGLY